VGIAPVCGVCVGIGVCGVCVGIGVTCGVCVGIGVTATVVALFGGGRVGQAEIAGTSNDGRQWP
jgi:hypothetical protein